MEDADVVRCRFKLERLIIDNNPLRGNVQIVSNKLLMIKHAYIEITGIASCKFMLNRTRIKFPRIYPKGTTVRGFEQFYYTRYTLCGGDSGNDTFHKHRNGQVYPFRCYWSSRLPGTWLGDYGHIEYRGKVTLRLINDEGFYTHSQLINVKYKRQLALKKHLLFDARVETARRFFTSMSVGNIHVAVWLPFCEIAAGQALPVFCTVVNHSRLHFGRLLFILTRTDIYRSDTPVIAVKKIRTDVCRVARMVYINRGKYDYYAVIQTDKDVIPTNQFYKCECCQVIYEVWVSVQGAFRRHRNFGYPKVDTPGLPVIIGTKPIRKFDTNEITAQICKKRYQYNEPLLVDELPEDIKEMIYKTDEELSHQGMENLERQPKENEKYAVLMKQESATKL